MNLFFGLLTAILLSVGANTKESLLVKHQIYTPYAVELEIELSLKGIDVERHSENELEVFIPENLSIEGILQRPYILLSSEKGGPLQLFNAGLGGYFNTEKAYRALEELEGNSPEWAKLHDLNEVFGLPKTNNKNTIKALQVTYQESLAGSVYDREKILIIGQHHAREVMTHHSVIDMARDLLGKIESGDEAMIDQLKKTSVWFVPVVNPDGLNHVFLKDKWWRKNRTRNSDGSFGVDLNRNYSFEWGRCGTNSDRGSSQVFRGPKAFSEVESQALDRLNQKLKAQYLISFHSHGDEVLFPYACHKHQTMTDQTLYYGLRDRLASELGYGKRYASSSGEDFEHHFNRHGSLSFLIEIGQEFQPSYGIYETTVAPKMKRILPLLFGELEYGFLKVEVKDKSGNPVVGAHIEIKEAPLRQGERRVTDEFGASRRKLSEELTRLTLKVSKPGMGEFVQEVSWDGTNKTVSIELATL